ncbi:MAG: hypothetical protein ACI30M_07155 [Muribaculaceae bacterium]
MKTKIQDFADILALAVCADGEYAEAERIVLGEIADAFEIEEATLVDAVEKSIAKIENLDEEQIGDLAVSAGEGILEEEVGEVFEAVLQIVLSDGILCREEAEVLLDIAEAIGIEAADALMLTADMVKAEDDVDVIL